MTQPLVITVDVEGLVDSGRFHSVDRLAALLEDTEIPATLFVTPSVVENKPETVADWIKGHHQVALHVHPGRLGGDSDWLETYERSAIATFLKRGIDTFEAVLGTSPEGFRAGRWSFSEAVLKACDDVEIEWDASHRPETRLDPYTRYGTEEFPMSVYSNSLLRVFLRPYGIDGIPLHADGFSKSRLRSFALSIATRLLSLGDSPYLMISFHDYDLAASQLRNRIEHYLKRVAASRRAVTIEDLRDGNAYSDA